MNTRMAAHGLLFAVVDGQSRRQTLVDEIPPMIEHGREPLGRGVGRALRPELEECGKGDFASAAKMSSRDLMRRAYITGAQSRAGALKA